MFKTPRLLSSRIVNSSFPRQTCVISTPTVLPSPKLRITMNAARSMASAAGGEQKAKTLSNQSKLPRLPVPELDKSLEGYLKSLIPVLEQKYGPKDLAKEIEKRKLFVRDFSSRDGLGRVLQERLKDLDHVSPHNWLDDTLWLALAYHTWRSPLLINSNYWLTYAPDPSDPPAPTYSDPASSSSANKVIQPPHDPSEAVAKGSQKGGEEWIKANKTEKGLSWDDAVSREEVTEHQVQKAAWMIHRHALFREMVQNETLSPDTSKAGPFDMYQYTRLFNFTRIPLPGSDAFSAIAPKATHITVMIDDFIYSVEVFSPASDHDTYPVPLSPQDIARNLSGVVQDARQRKRRGEEADRVGILTADHRDTWTKNREKILLLSPKNRETFDSISSSMMCLYLDTYTLPSIPTSDPLAVPSVDAQMRNCASGINGARNRWLDKSISLVMETNGRAGLCGEHSPIDALIPSNVMAFVAAVPVDKSAFSDSSEAGVSSGWKREDWVLDEAIKREIVECEERNKKLIEDSNASELWWAEYGADWIKKNAKVSPDAYIQQALQLAWYKDQGYATATYETASTRAMLHGRTDVIRTLSVESRSFVKGMLDSSTDDTKRYKLLTEACSAHNALTRQSSAGHGWDRHMMGLKVMLRGDETHQIFEDEMYSKSQEWKLSTSGLSAGAHMTGTGFGAAWPDGYGINYLGGPYLLKFGVESKWSCDATSTARFKHNLAQSLRDMRRIVEAQQGAGGEAVKAKL